MIQLFYHLFYHHSIILYHPLIILLMNMLINSSCFFCLHIIILLFHHSYLFFLYQSFFIYSLYRPSSRFFTPFLYRFSNLPISLFIHLHCILSLMSIHSIRIRYTCNALVYFWNDSQDVDSMKLIRDCFCSADFLLPFLRNENVNIIELEEEQK